MSRADADALKLFVDDLIPALEPIAVVQNRTGLVMVPYADSAQNSQFYIGEALIAEARVTILGGKAEGYGACMGYDLEQALAIALIDAALVAPTQSDSIYTFIDSQKMLQDEADDALLKAVESTRAEMETF